MATNYVRPGNVITAKAVTSKADANSARIIGGVLAVALTDIPLNADGPWAIEGVWELPKLSTAVIAVDDSLNWARSAGNFIKTPGAQNDLIGCATAVEAAGNGTTTVKVRLTPGAGVLKP